MLFIGVTLYIVEKPVLCCSVNEKNRVLFLIQGIIKPTLDIALQFELWADCDCVPFAVRSLSWPTPNFFAYIVS